MRRKYLGCIAAVSLVFTLAVPGLAFAQVTVDDTTLEAGENSVGGGTATYVDSVLDMVGVTAGNVTTDEDLTVNFNGGNDIDHFEATGDSNVTVNFSGENAVEDLEAHDNANIDAGAICSTASRCAGRKHSQPRSPSEFQSTPKHE